MKRRLSALLFLMLAIGFAALGVWQIERRAWKHALIARVGARIHAAPAPLPPRAQWGRDHAYRRIRVTGRFRHDRETLVQAVTVLGAGWWVMTPLETGDTTLLVNRGFVPPDRGDAATRRAGQVSGTVTIIGLIRDSERGGAFLRRNDPASDRWVSRDVDAIARARAIAGTPPFFLDADARPNPGGWPAGGLTIVQFTDHHLVYALTWFTLAAMSIAASLTVSRPASWPRS